MRVIRLDTVKIYEIVISNFNTFMFSMKINSISLKNHVYFPNFACFIVQECVYPYMWGLFFIYGFYFAEGISGHEPCCSSEWGILRCQEVAYYSSFTACGWGDNMARSEYKMSVILITCNAQIVLVKFRTCSSNFHLYNWYISFFPLNFYLYNVCV